MGHTRIGRLNRSKKWRDVISSYCAGADFEQISKMVLDAASEGVNEQRLLNDAGYQKAVELLVQLGIGAQNGNLIEHMKSCEVFLSDKPSTQELIAKLNEAIDDATWNNSVRDTDLGEHAKQALANAITSCVKSERDGELPNMPQRYDADIFNKFGSKSNFAELNRVFISRTMGHALNSYLAKIIPNIAGQNERVKSVHELKASYDALNQHCYETAQVHLDYATQWLGKHQHQLKDMTPYRIKQHANFLVKKMMRALKYGTD